MTNMDFGELCDIYKEDPSQLYELMEKGVDMNATAYRRVTFLMYVVKRSCDAKLVRAMIDSGADVHARNLFGRTALMISAKNQDAPEVIQALVDAGSDVNAIDDYGNDALTYSHIYCRCPRVTKILKKASRKNIISFDSFN